MSSARSGLRSFAMLGLSVAVFLVGRSSLADTLDANEFAVTATASWETTPRLGNDGVSDLVVFTRSEPLPSGNPGKGDIWFQRLAGGAPLGEAQQVTFGSQDNQLNDVSGDYIVYTAYDSTSSMSGRIMVYQISTTLLYGIGSALIIQEPRISGTKVVWLEGGAAAMVMLYDLGWLGTMRNANIIAGPTPPVFTLDIGDRFIVWAENIGGQLDVVAYEIASGTRVAVTATLSTNEREPSTSGAWITWEAQDKGAAIPRVVARNLDTAEERIIADSGVGNYEPSIDGDIIGYESNLNGNFDVFVYRISTAETFQVTADPADQYLNDVFGQSIAYVDERTATSDIYVSDLIFLPPDPCAELGGDSDGDGVCSAVDNCPNDPNPDQADSNGNGIGDVCEPLPPLAAAGPDQTVHVGSQATLDGSGSSDPGGLLPLTYAWRFVSQPPGVQQAELSDPAAMSPTFTPFSSGDYVLELAVTNTAGRQGSDTITISTSNSSPVADAGTDQLVTAPGTVVHLDGSQSYDPDGDALMFVWLLLEKPTGSQATIQFDSKNPAFPTFVADVYGSYVVQLVVSDNWASSAADTVTISFENLKPVADAGASGSADVDTIVTLDGSASIDPNGDPLTYAWMLVSFPTGSSASISEPSSVSPVFTPDKAGTYVIQLIVSDGLLASDPSTVQIQAIMTQSAAVATVVDLQAVVAALPASAFKNGNMRNALNNKLNAVIAAIEAGNYASALQKLENDILGKTDGCANSSPVNPDNNDWLKSCEEQEVLYPLVNDVIAAVLDLI